MKKSVYFILSIIMLTIFISGCSNEPKEDDLKTSAWALSSVCSAVYRGVQDGSISDSSTYQDGTPVTWAAEKNSNMITKREAAEKVTVQQALDYYKGVSLNTILKTMNIENFDIQSALSSGKYVYVNKVILTEIADSMLFFIKMIPK